MAITNNRTVMSDSTYGAAPAAGTVNPTPQKDRGAEAVARDLANEAKNAIKSGGAVQSTGGYGRGGGGGSGGGGGGKSYTVPTLPSATSQAEYLTAMYDANRAAEEANLRAAYEQNMANLEYQAAQIDPTYARAANQAAVQAEINRQNFNNSALASGLNTGAGSQALLSQQNAAQANQTSIRQAQADAVAKINLERTQQEAAYRNAINEAIAKNDLERAQALYQEAKRVDDSLVATAINQANLDWTVWNALYNKR